MSLKCHSPILHVNNNINNNIKFYNPERNAIRTDNTIRDLRPLMIFM